MDLTTTYMGLELRSPLVVSPNPLSERIDDIKRMEEEGAGAVVLYSLFEEQLTLSDEALVRLIGDGASYAETLANLPEHGRVHVGPLKYLEHIQNAKRAVKVPIIASVNGAPHPRWMHYARLMEQAGADALELNLYYVPDDPTETGGMLEQRYLALLEAIRARVSIPIAVKLQPFFTNLASFARQLDDAGADALVLFNRFYQPDFELEDGSPRYSVNLSSPQTLRLRLRWIELLSGQIKASLAATGGVENATDALKVIAKGGDVVMLCSTLLRHGLHRIKEIEQGIRAWLDGHDYTSVKSFRGRYIRKHEKNLAAVERAQYMRNLDSFDEEHPDGSLSPLRFDL